MPLLYERIREKINLRLFFKLAEACRGGNEPSTEPGLLFGSRAASRPDLFGDSLLRLSQNEP